MIRKTYPWKEMPFIRLLPPYICGILVNKYLFVEPPAILVINCIILMVIIVLEMLKSSVAWRYRFFRGVMINIFLTGFGMLSVMVHSEPIKRDYQKLESLHHEVTLLRMLEPLTAKNNSWSGTAEISLINKHKEVHTQCKALIYFPKNTDTTRITYGTRILTAAQLQPIINNGNPGSFDFRKYYAEQSIFYRIYPGKNNFTILPGTSSNPLFHLVYTIRNRLLAILGTHIRDPSALGLAEALLIGYRNNLDKTLLNVYANTGVVHVIAISGLHLGLIYAILMYITGKLTRRNNRKYIQILLVIPSLWIFSLATGASPSVIRSAVMFTLLCFGQLLGKKSHSMNAVAASAFLLLSYFPSWITDTGFLLSYAAVFGILLFQRRITQSCYFSNPLALKFWESISLTLAAQILTTPLILFYFHRFPLLFLFTNLVAVPLSGLILILELMLCVAGLAGLPADQIGKLIEQLILFLNSYVLKMDAVPHTVLHIRNFTLFQLVMMYWFILFISLGIIYRNRKLIFASLLTVSLFSAADRTQQYHADRREQVAILNINRSQALGIIRGRYLQLYMGMTGEEKNTYHQKLLPVLGHFMIDSMEIKPAFKKHLLLLVKKPAVTLYIAAGSRYPDYPFPDSLSALPDLVMLSGNADVSIAELFRRIPCRTWVADASNNLWKIQKWKKEAEQLHLRFHSVPEQGAFLLKKD